MELEKAGLERRNSKILLRETVPEEVVLQKITLQEIVLQKIAMRETVRIEEAGARRRKR